MRCKNCEYRLWNLTSRTCPECGTPFAPSDFEFVPNSVSFRCPHCAQDYYGTDANGHLVPSAFECVHCRQPITMDEMILMPAEGVEEESTQAGELPWLARKQHGFFKCWFKMLGMALVQPTRVMQLAPVADTAPSAWWFAFVTNAIVMLCASLPTALLMGGLGGPGGVLLFPATLLGCGGIIVFLILAVWTLVTHGILHITGRVKHPLERTAQCMCFSSGANAISAIPCLGFYVGWIWWVVSAILMLREGQKVGGLRATFAVLVLPAAMLVGGAFWIGYQFNQVMNFQSTFTFTMTTETQEVTDAIMRYAETNEYRGPDHALRLVSDDLLIAADMWTTDSATYSSDIPVNELTLEDFEFMTPVEQTGAVDRSAASLPPNVIAHRVGDFVFTYHEITLDDCPPDLWIVVCAPDPDVNMVNTGNITTNGFNPNAPIATLTTLAVGQVDGTVKQLFIPQLAAELTKQNNLRATKNLPPLPDPFKVTHDKPAVAPASP